MGYSLSCKEVEKRERYVKRVRALDERFKKFGLEYLPGDRSEVYKPIIVFPEHTTKSSRVGLYTQMGIRRAAKIIKQMEDNIITRDKLKKYALQG